MRTVAVPLTKGERLYRIGVNKDCPLHMIYAGGQCFPKTSEKVTGYGIETQRSKIDGAVVRMQEGQLERCIESAKHKVIRMTGRGARRGRARVYDTRARNYRPMPGDVPVLSYMYAEPLDEARNPMQDVRRRTLQEEIDLASATEDSKPKGRRGK